jgi:formylglycine-generating enzyme required for sulfatase activity
MAQPTKRYILNYDATQNPPAGSPATAELFSGLVDLHKKGSRILEKKDPFVYPSSDKIVVRQGTIVALFNNLWRSFEIDAEIELSAADIDVGGAFSVGSDYYVYLVDDGGNGALVVSANATFPSGAAADNSRKIGGFHFGHIRCTNARFAPIDPNGVVYGANGGGWQNNVATGIVPNSVWDLKNRPNCSPEGMVLVGHRWVDIYKASVAETVTFENGVNGLFVADGLLQSKYGQLPATGTEGLNWYSFQELASRAGKRLQTYAEFVQGAAGNPGGQDAADDYGWTKTSNSARCRTGCRVNASTGAYDPAAGVKPYAVSAHNLVDAIGNVEEWVNDLSIYDAGSTTAASYDVLGADKGQLYAYSSTGLHAFLCGGYWNNGVRGGARNVRLNSYPWNVSTSFGSRLACDKLAA